MFAKQREDVSHAAKGGIVAGIVGGLVIAVYMLIGTVAQGGDPWMPLKGAGVPFLGSRAMAPGFDAAAVLVGVLGHFAVSIAWGILFGLIFWGLSRPATVAAGAIWGLVVWVGMYYMVLPLIGLGAMARSVPVSMAILTHVIFGLGVGVGFLPFQRELPRPIDMGPVGPPVR